MQKIYRARLVAVAFGVSFGVLPMVAQAAISDPSSVRETVGERFQLPSPMSREYMRINRSTVRPSEGQGQTPVAPRAQSETN